MNRTAVLLGLSLLANAVLLGMVFSKPSHDPSHRADYEASVQALTEAERYLASLSKGEQLDKNTQALFQSYRMVDTSLIFFHQYNPSFSNNGLPTGNLQLVLEELQYELAIAMNHVLIEKTVEGQHDRIANVQNEIKDVLTKLPGNYDYSTVKDGLQKLQGGQPIKNDPSLARGH